MAMDGVATTMPAHVAAPPVARCAGIFLHAGWRSCGTWIWERLRENSGVQGFYEPLHEDLARLRRRDVGLLRPDSWQSGHGTGAPYFSEYAPLLRPAGGVRGHAARFAFDDYFRPPDQDDAELEGYLRGLIADAGSNARLPVLKFCRSLGRVSWLEARFPDMLHAIILRDPQAQWRSARRQMEQNGNRYFVVAPFVILARNAHNALLADAAERLCVKLPPGLGRSLTRDLSVTTDACWRHVSRLSWEERFRGFMALWITTSITALQGSATLIDADRLCSDAELRGAAEAAMAEVVGLPVDLMPSINEPAKAGGSQAERADAHAAMKAALGFLQAHEVDLDSNRAVVLTSKLQTGFLEDDLRPAYGALQPGALAWVDALAYVALLRASYPLRRAHFHVQRWMDGDIGKARKEGGA